MNRRSTLLASAAVAIGAPFIVAGSCAVNNTNAQATAAKIVAVAQAFQTTITNALSLYKVTLTGDAATAWAAAQGAVSGLADQASNGATAVAQFAANGTASVFAVLNAAGKLVLPVLAAIPAAAPAVPMVQDAMLMLPLLQVLAQTILAPAAAGAGNLDAYAAARRLGVRV